MTTTIPTATAQAAPVPGPLMSNLDAGSAVLKRSAEILQEAAEGVRLQNRGGEAHGAGQTGFDFEGNAVTGSASQSDLKPSSSISKFESDHAAWPNSNQIMRPGRAL